MPSYRSPPVLHRHALECILAFGRLRDLHSACCVSHAFAAAVDSMRPLCVPLPLPDRVQLRTICVSRLARHMGELTEHESRSGPIGVEQSLHATLAARMPNLRVLYVGAVERTAEAVQSLVDAVSQLPHLQRLCVDIGPASYNTSLAPLRRLPALRWLSLDGDAAQKSLTKQQVADLRNMPTLERLHFHHRLSLPLPVLRRLLQPPHDLQWQSLGLFREPDDATAAVVGLLPTLTELRWNYSLQSHVDVLLQLPALRVLDLSFKLGVPGSADAGASIVDSVRVFAALALCRSLEELTLQGSPSPDDLQLTDTALATCLPHMPRMRALRLFGVQLQSGSLALFSTDALIDSLQLLELNLTNPVATVELQHCVALRHLEELRLWQSNFASPLPPLLRRALQPGSPAMPRLRECSLYK